MGENDAMNLDGPMTISKALLYVFVAGVLLYPAFLMGMGRRRVHQLVAKLRAVNIVARQG